MCSGDQDNGTMDNWCKHEFIFGSNPRGRLSSPNAFRDVYNDSNYQRYDVINARPPNTEKEVDQTGYEKRMEDLTQKLKELEHSNNELRKRLDEAVEEKQEAYCRLEVISVAHESRITEMHCVIAELSKKLRAKQDATIAEESEQEGSELSFQCESARDSEAGGESVADNKVEVDEASPEPQTEPPLPSIPAHKNQVEALQEEVLHLKAQIAFLQSQIANENDSSPEAHQQTNNKDLYQDETVDATYDNANDPKTEYENWNLLQTQLADEEMLGQQYILTKENINQVGKQQSSAPITKVAERVKLRRTIEDTSLTDSAVLSSGVNPIEVVENLMSSIIQPENIIEDEISTSELKIEVQRLQRRVDNLKARNSVLTLTLNECKRHCEHLYLLCGKYESNAIALQAALNCSDRAIEAYDVMLALLESKLALLKDKSIAAQESRHAVEAVARHLLDRLDSERSFNENSLGPWQNTVCISNSQIIDPWTQEDDNRLRNHVSKLKGRRSTIQNTVVTFESPFYTEPEISKTFTDFSKEAVHENPQVDLEMAVLMQEMLSLREDVIETRQKAERTERDKHIAFEKVRLLQDALSQLQAHLTESEVLVDLATKNRSSYSEVDHAAVIERQLIEALTRESQLKSRIQSLIGTASVTKKTSEEKYTKVQNNLTELQKANLNLSRSLELHKRKYQTRIKRLEQKIMELNRIISQQQQCPADNIPETTL
ncbi:unnamed protein product [Hermetia illucens]|uniref:Harmonin-binding protein USHBP1 PDZ-binding domain-containing protein n=2 Tax=Hermetia illucens TaxID=343691 RepID=A0A7R8YTJ9_HERIL|nr:unnamed protein product [Hermetia illucens]